MRLSQRSLAGLLVVLMGSWFVNAYAQRRSDRENPYEKVSDVYRDHWKKGNLAKALEHVDSAIRASAEGVPIYWLTDRAELFFQMGEVTRAIDEVEWLQYRRPSPIYAWQLARYYQHAGKLSKFDELIEQAWRRASRYRRDDLETDEALALNAIAEVRGDNPRDIFQSILNGKMKTKEDRLLRYVAAGNLAVSKFDYALAATYFDKALAEDETDLPALGGLAKCFWHSADSRLDGILDRIEAINPHDSVAAQIRTERELDANDLEPALNRIDKQLTRNPLNLTFRGLKLAAFFLQDNKPGMAALEMDTLNYNPHASEVFRIAGRIASRHYRFTEGAAFQKKALEANANDVLAKAFYAQDLLRLGQDELGRKMLTEAFAGDRFNVQVFNLLELLDKVADFEVMENKAFQLRMPKKEVPVWGEDVLDLLNDSFKTFSKKYDVRLKTPVAIQIFDNHDDFMVRSVGLPGNAGHLGICFGQLVTMDSPSARTPGAMNWRSVMLHEFVHVITLQKTANRMERWLSEGISVYEQIEADPGWAHGLDMDYKWIVEADGIPGVADIPKLFTEPRTGTHLMFGYFTAGEFVRFYVDRYGFGTLNKAMEGIRKGQLTLDALLEASSVSEKEMSKEFRAFLKQRFKPFDVMPEVNPTFLKAYKDRDASFVGMPFEPEPGAFHQTLEKAEKALQQKAIKEAETAFWKAHELYPDYQGEGEPLARLATMYADQKREEDLEKVLKKAAFGRETAFWACLSLANYYKDKQNWQGLADIARRGLDIDPFDLLMNRYQMEAFGKLNRKEAQLQALKTLVDLDKDRAFSYRLQRIDLLLEKGAKTAAKEETLELLEEMPSSWEAQQRLLKVIDGGGL